MAASRTIDENTLELVVHVKEMLSAPETSVADVVRAMAQLSTSSNMFEALAWVKAEDEGYSSCSGSFPTYRQLRLKGADAEIDCMSIGEHNVPRRISVTDKYFRAHINSEFLEERNGQIYWNCRYSTEKLTRNLCGMGDVEIGEGENWTDRSPCFGVFGREYKHVRIVSDFDDVKNMLNAIRQKCESDFLRVLESNKQLTERMKTMKERMDRNVRIEVSGSDNQIACGGGSVTQQQALSNGMFSKAQVGDADSSSRVNGGSLIGEILKRPLLVIGIIVAVAFLLGLVVWNAKNVVVENGGTKVGVQFNDR